MNNRIKKVGITFGDLAGILSGRAVVIPGIPSDAEILSVCNEDMHGIASMIVTSKEYSELSIGACIPQETSAFAYLERKKV